ncbi:substrate-binding periplasmic protein [Undibacterium sp. JH2W]|uniref:substrate-binding periplasmic protein n=1 Tax=Undibacterium sp. JH2W TaxID=3413037 RepID=UPI003BF150D8
MRSSIAWLLSLLLLGWMNVGFAQKVYVIGVEDLEYYPQYSHKDGQYIGFARELLDAFAKSKGYKFEYKILPLNRLFLEHLHGSGLDFQYPDNVYWEAQLRTGVKIYYSKPVMPFIDGVVVLPGNKGRGKKHLQVLGTMTGFTPWNYLDAIKNKEVTVFENDSFISLLKQTMLKRVDGAYINIEVARYQLREILHQPDALVFDPDLPHTKDYYYLSSTKHPQVIQEFNEFLVKEKDLYEQSRKKLAIESSIFDKK